MYYLHRGFCVKCAAQLQYCPLCRGEIVLTVHDEESDMPTTTTTPSPTNVSQTEGGDVFPAIT